MSSGEPQPDADRDVVIVGGGPAGATAAYRLETLGFDTLVVDAAEFPRHKLCGGLLTDKTLRLLDRLYDETPGSLRDRDVLEFASAEYEVRYRDDRLLRGEADRPFYFVDRSVYDNFLFERAREAGADTLEGHRVTSVDPDAPAVTTADGRTLRGRYLLGADGANSVVRRRLFREGLVAEEGWRDDLAMAVEAFVPRDAAGPVADVDRLVIHFGVLEWGYGWVFPNEDRLLVGVGGLNHENDNFRDLLADYLDHLGIGHLSPEVHGHPIPFGNFLDDPTHGRVLLAGDAAGTVDAITGEGIFYGQRTGELAGWAIDRAEEGRVPDAAAHYRDLLGEYVHPELRESKAGRPLIWAGPERPRRMAMNVWMRALGERLVEVIHGVRVYRWLRKRGRVRHDPV